MNDFTYYNPVKVIFGKNSINSLVQELPQDAKPLLLYGGGSIKKNGVYDQITSSLTSFSFVEFGGIPANPTYEKCLEAVDLIKKEKCTFIIAAGGGSVVDAAKFIAAAVCFAGDPWEILLGSEITKALPFGAILTLPATGSEMNRNAVISKKATNEKLYFGSPLVFPQFSILDPQTTFTLPPRQTINGIVDTFIHTCEQYLTIPNDTPLQDRQAEAILHTLLEEGPKVLANPLEYTSRANIMWCSTNALNHLIGCGTVEDWATHMIGHELTALYGLDHAVTLAIVAPRVWTYRMEYKHDKLTQYAQRVWGITGRNASLKAIGKTEQFFNKIGVKTSLEEYGIDSVEAAQKVSKRFVKRGTVIGENGTIDPEMVEAILRSC